MRSQTGRRNTARRLMREIADQCPPQQLFPTQFPPLVHANPLQILLYGFVAEDFKRRKEDTVIAEKVNGRQDN